MLFRQHGVYNRPKFHWGRSVRRRAQRLMDGLHFSFRSNCLTRERVTKPHRDGAQEVRRLGLTKTYCRPRILCAEWSRALLNNSPRHHSGSGRDWPYKATSRPSDSDETGLTKSDRCLSIMAWRCRKTILFHFLSRPILRVSYSSPRRKKCRRRITGPCARSWRLLSP